MPRPARKLAAIMAADVVEYSRHMAADEARTLAHLRWLRKEVLGPVVETNHGQVIKSMGDGWLVEFRTVVDDVESAIQIQQSVSSHDGTKLRIGLHVGDIVHEDDDIYGDGVNIAARLQQSAQPGGIMISDAAFKSLDSVHGDRFVALGARRLKNIPSAILVHGWRDAVGGSSPPVRSGKTASWSDPEVLIAALAKSGDRDAFAQLVERRQSWVRNLLRRSCGDPVLADDLAQQTFLQAWRSIRQLKNPEKFAPWLRRLAINIWLQQVRKHDATRNSEELREADIVQNAGTGAAIDLDRALGTLPEHVRLCVVLSHGEGMTGAEIAEHTGIPLGTVKSHIRRGIERLQKMLADYKGAVEPENEK